MKTLERSVGAMVLRRHSETTWSLSGQSTDTTDPALTANGEGAARELAPFPARLCFDLALTSPLQRAQRTCELAGLGEQLVNDPDRRAWESGPYKSLTSAENPLEAPGWLVFNDGGPGLESPQPLGERVERVIAPARQQKGPVARFAHGHLLRVLAARWTGLTPDQGSHCLLDTSTLSVLSHYRDLPALKGWNAPLLEASPVR